ncbi:hypothetical protein AvCA_45970 [Azotobacter vinelandii CA]|uniref:Uncharacterized protein n=2 Tax=Azotobacter vinelandii TaxID=354 RepID=C1DHX4_AZOVD|nr:hypothetical protein Avin_45970 [Azotobacter vinelandii DJ]AGK14310.1 hypothetical protein AvCA_45970 [Azotobacter vinelandii CA]AGK22101.1 hypothetical protein AvCA6_45970 [Azotobacter vinelandii CA6]
MILWGSLRDRTEQRRARRKTAGAPPDGPAERDEPLPGRTYEPGPSKNPRTDDSVRGFAKGA